MRPRRFVLVLLLGLSFVLGLTIVVMEVMTAETAAAGGDIVTPDTTPKASFPSQRDFQQSFSAERSSSSASFLEGSFLYANTTYTYRYSTKLFSKQYPILRVGNNVLPAVIFGVCANGAKPVRRQAIRKSWGKNKPVYFLVAGNWESVSKEFGSFGDLLFVDIPEDYRNALTPKTFAFIQFASQKAIPAFSQTGNHRPMEYMFKTDDDVYINATEMSLELYAHGRPDYYGLMRNGTAPIRNKTEDGLLSKWYMRQEEYPHNVFPPYAHGTGYALSKRFGDCASKAMANIITMPWEDVATGMLAEACRVDLTPSDEDWDHFAPMGSPESEWKEFPYHRFKNGSVLVKILHKVKPWFFEPLSRQASLVEAREYGGQKRKEKRQRVAGGG